MPTAANVAAAASAASLAPPPLLACLAASSAAAMASSAALLDCDPTTSSTIDASFTIAAAYFSRVAPFVSDSRICWLVRNLRYDIAAADAAAMRFTATGSFGVYFSSSMITFWESSYRRCRLSNASVTASFSLALKGARGAGRRKPV